MIYMTNEEAINTLKVILEEATETEDSICYVTSGDADALKAAIKALEIQPCEDCISKTEVINTIHKTIYGFFDIADDDSEEPINDKDKLLLTINKAISNAVKALPSVTPQPKMGKWNYVTHYARRYRVCSECNAEKEDDRATGWNFCPHCGTDMRGDKNDEI